MAYSELIKNFERIRDYMRQFYVYGFKSREEYNDKSSRSYDNERRRIESWMGEYMSFHQDATGKNIFLSVDSRRVPHNPLHKAFKAKSFTDKDITLHFYLMDILADGLLHSFHEIVERINDDYLANFEDAFSLDESTVRKKLKEYENLGLLHSEKQGREVLYQRTDDPHFNLSSWDEALSFYSEADPLGVIGSYLVDRLDTISDTFRFKHHYILHTLDSDNLCTILQAIDEQRAIEITFKGLKSGKEFQGTVCPLKIYVSTQSGRQYLLGYHYIGRHMVFYRLDTIKLVALGNTERQYDKYVRYQEKFDENLWGVSTGAEYSMDHLEMTIRYGWGEGYILQRLEREKRHGYIEIIDEHHCKYVADVFDAGEMLPWLRTFIGRIVDLQCSNRHVVDTFYKDLAQMKAMYGGDENAV